MKLKITTSLAIVLATTLPPINTAAFTNILDFETVLGAVPIEGMSISNQFVAQFGISFRTPGSFPVIARKGYPLAGFWTGDIGAATTYDTIEPQDTNAAAFGQFFLTRDSDSRRTIIMDFVIPVSRATGFILDIDGREEATITAYRDDGVSMVGQLVITNTSPGAGAQRGAPWSFSRPTNDIHQIRFFVTTSPGPYGLDNITSSFAPPAPQAAANSMRMYPGITIGGEVGRPYQIEYTNRLTAGRWIALTNFYLPSSPFLFFDVTATNSPQRFYQVIGLQ